MDITRNEYNDAIHYELHVAGEGYRINTSGTKVNNHLVVMGSNGQSGISFNPKVLAVYDISTGTDLDSLILSEFEKYAKNCFGNSEFRNRLFSEALGKYYSERAGPVRLVSG